MPLYVSNRQDKVILPSGMEKVLQELLAAIQQAASMPPEGEVALTFVDDAAMRELNRQYRGNDAPTDVLAFSMQEKAADEPELSEGPPEMPLGDVVISAETAQKQARENGHALLQEIALLAVHGMLHLAGYDHSSPETLQVMEARQEELLREVGLAPGDRPVTMLLQLAARVSQNAYAPYSGCAVGAALLGVSGEIYLGCNVENASYGLSLCAERAAIAQAVAAGEKEFQALALVAGDSQPLFPCGACRQFLSEFGDPVIIIPASEGCSQWRLSELLPQPFSFR